MGWGIVAAIAFAVALGAVVGWVLLRRAGGGREAGPVEPWQPEAGGDARRTARRRSIGH